MWHSTNSRRSGERAEKYHRSGAKAVAVIGNARCETGHSNASENFNDPKIVASEVEEGRKNGKPRIL
jgi:hypothetical protein